MGLGAKMENLVDLAVEKGIVNSKKQFAEKMGLHEASMYRMFKNNTIKAKNIEKACEIVGISIQEFYHLPDTINEMNEPLVRYLTRHERAESELNDCKTKLQVAEKEINNLVEQMKLKDQIISIYERKAR